MIRKRKKQVIIIFIYLLILLFIIGGIYLLIKSKIPTCYDGVQNQGEAGIDCGGPCDFCSWQLQEDLEIVFAKVIKTQDNYQDLVAKIKNPNQNFGAKLFSYKFNLYNSENKLALSKKGDSYILPRETRYIIDQKVLVDFKVSNVELEIININWQELGDYYEPELLIKNSNFEQTENFSRISGTLENRNNYNFDKIDIYGVLFDKNSELLAGGKTEIKTILSKENRYFEIKWPFSIKGIDKIDITAKTNIFLDENFIKQYEEERKQFQEY